MSENFENEKAENQRLKSYIKEIIKDIEEKAPILKRQKAEYEEAILSVGSLTTQLENAMMVCILCFTQILPHKGFTLDRYRSVISTPKRQ